MGRSGIGTYHIYGSKATITLPTHMWKHDDRFPFKDKQKVEVEIVFPKMTVDGKKVENMSKGKAIIITNPKNKLDKKSKDVQKVLENG
jgi:hypothetical protein